MTVWTLDAVEHRFHEAAVTSHRLPPARVADYVTMWPEIARQAWEGDDDELDAPFASISSRSCDVPNFSAHQGAEGHVWHSARPPPIS